MQVEKTTPKMYTARSCRSPNVMELINLGIIKSIQVYQKMCRILQVDNKHDKKIKNMS